MAHQHDRPLERHESLFQQLQRFGIEIVRRLVEDDDVRRLRKQLRQQHAVSLAAGQKLHRRAGSFGAKQKVLQIADDVPRLAFDKDRVGAVADVFLDRGFFVQLTAQLVEVGEL